MPKAEATWRENYNFAGQDSGRDWRENLEESKEMIVVAGGDHAESEDDTGGSPDIETELPSEEICEGAEDEGSQDEADHGEGVEVRHFHGIITNPVVFCDCGIFEL